MQAARALLTKEGWDGLTIERVARAAGVGKSSVYRRWPNKTALALDATVEPVLDLDAAVDIPQGLAELIESTARDFNRPDFRAALPGFVAESLVSDQVNRTRLEPEVQLVARLLAGPTGNPSETRAEAALLAELYLGGVLMRVLRGGTPTAEYRKRLRSFLLRGLGLAIEADRND